MTEPDPVDDPRLRFFLERRDLIEEWVEAGAAEPAYLDRYLARLEEDLVDLAESNGAELGIIDLGGDRVLALTKPAWVAVPTPVAAIGLGWWPKTVRLGGLKRQYPWVGIRVRRSEPWGNVHQALLELIEAETSGDAARFDKRTKGNWIAYRWVPCEHQRYWDDLTPYRSELIDLVSVSWRVFSPLVDRAIADSQADHP